MSLVRETKKSHAMCFLSSTKRRDGSSEADNITVRPARGLVDTSTAPGKGWCRDTSELRGMRIMLHLLRGARKEA